MQPQSDWPHTLEEFRVRHARQPEVWEFIDGTQRLNDIGRKLSLYLKIPSLRHDLVIHQDRRQIVHDERQDDRGGRFLTNIAPADPLRLDPPGVEVAFEAVYQGVPLE